MTEQRFGIEIRLLREQKKLSAKDLAERVGLSPSQMSRLESGQRRVDAVLLSKIARALDVHPSYFFQGFEDKGSGRHTRAATEPGPIIPTPAARLGKIIRAERRRRHLTAEELALKIGKGKAFLQGLEAGENDLVTGEVLQKIAKTLKLDIDVLLDAQRAEIRDLRRSLRRLERAHTERTLGELQLEGPGTVKRGLPIVEAEDGGLPAHFDKGVPEGRVSDYLHVPGLRVNAGFAVRLKGDEMTGTSGARTFAAGDLLVFSSDREARHRDFVLAALEGRSVFRELFLEPKGRVRLQPLNLDYPPLILDREEVLELFPLAARLQTL